LNRDGRKTGFWLEEFAAPYFVFRDAVGRPPLTLDFGRIARLRASGACTPCSSSYVRSQESPFCAKSTQLQELFPRYSLRLKASPHFLRHITAILPEQE